MTKNAKYQKERAKEMALKISHTAFKASLWNTWTGGRLYIQASSQHKRLQLIKEKI